MSATGVPLLGDFSEVRSRTIFEDLQKTIATATDRRLLCLMVVQYAAGVAAAVWLSPSAWEGMSSHLHPHVVSAVVLGAILVSLPITLAALCPGALITRHAMATGQMLVSGLLVHLSGGRIETHFHVFGSLAFLSFYRDWRVLVTASAVVAADHLTRGMFFPESMYGVPAAPLWRSFEHVGWVVFEDAFLMISIRQSVREMLSIGERQAALEFSHTSIERTVEQRTSELTIEIAERRQAEDSLRLSEQRFRQLAESIEGVFWIKSPDLRELLYVSPAYEQIWGRSCASLYLDPATCADCILPEDRAAAEVGAVKAVRGEPYETEYRIARPTGDVRWILSRGFPVLDEDGKLARVVGLATDVTERKGMESKMMEASRMETVGRLAAGIAHDFNTILTEVIGHAELIQEAARANAAASRSASAIVRSTTRAARLTQQLLAFGRKQMFRFQNLDVNKIVLELEPMLRGMLRPEITLEIRTRAARPQTKADLTQIQHMLVQLVSNAQDAMRQEGRIIIETGNTTLEDHGTQIKDNVLQEEYLTISVSDNGVGIPEHVLPRLFEPFFTTKAPATGTGLGLSMCYGIAKQLGGHIVASSEPGQGASLDIYLPCLLVQPSMSETESTLPLIGRLPQSIATATILLVEENANLRALASAALKAKGFNVYAAESQLEAIDIVKQIPCIALLLADESTGLELAARLRVLNPTLRLLLVASRDDGKEKLSTGLPWQTFLQKPYSPATLCQKAFEALHCEIGSQV